MHKIAASDLIPHGNNILVSRVRVEEPKMGGMLVADTIAAKIPPQQGQVLSVGARVKKVKPGMMIVFGQGTDVPVIDELAFVNERHVIGEVIKA